MESSTKFKTIALVIGFFLLNNIYCKAESANSVSSQLGDLQKLIGGFEKKKNKASDHSKKVTFEDLEKRIDEMGKDFTKSKEELLLREKVGQKRKRLDAIKSALAIPSIIQASQTKKREAETRKLKNLFNQLKSGESKLNPQDLDTSELDEACSKGVDFSQFKKISDQMSSSPFQWLKKNAQELLKKWDEKAKKDMLNSIQKLAAHFDKIASNPERDEAEEANRSIFDEEMNLNARLERLKQKAAELDSNIVKEGKKLVKTFFTDFMPALMKAKEDDGKLSEIAGKFADNLEEFRKASLEAAIKNTDKLRKNCNKLIDELGADSPFAPNKLLGRSYQWYRHYTKRDERDKHTQQFLAAIVDLSQRLKCKNATKEVDGLFSGTLKKAIDALRAAKDPKTLLEGAMKAMNAIGEAQAGVGKAIKPLKNDCELAAKEAKKAKDFIMNVAQKTQEYKEKKKEKEAENSEPNGMGPQAKPHSKKAANAQTPSHDAMAR